MTSHQGQQKENEVQLISMDESFLKKLQEAVEANLRNEQFGVETLAKEIGLSRYQIHRKLHALTGQSVSQYIREYRLNRAMKLLKARVGTASEIAFDVGFASPAYFNKCFNEFYGYPPGEVKKMISGEEVSQEIRRLTAIMFTQIVGYTELISSDEDKAFRLLRKNRRIQKPIIEKYKGKWLKEIGEGILTSFSSVLNAVECAIEIQDSLQADSELKVCIGIHLGEVIFKNNEVFGDGVNIASRIQELAKSGQILVSDAIIKNTKNYLGVEAIDLEIRKLKNVDESLSIYLVRRASPRTNPLSHVDFKQALPLRKLHSFVISFSLIMVVLMIMLFVYKDKMKRRHEQIQWAYQYAIPHIEKLVDNLSYYQLISGTGPDAWEAYFLTQEVKEIIPNDPKLKKLEERCSYEITVTSQPPGASVYAKPYLKSDSFYKLMGITPLENYRFPSGNLNLKIEKAGYEPIFDLVWVQNSVIPKKEYILDTIGSIPENMSLVRPVIDTLWLQWIGLRPFIENPDIFLVDKYEVSNREYKVFVQAGAYQNPVYWNEPFVKDGDTINWDAAMKLFVDQTDRPGPSSWVGGDYPEGEDDYPVTGVSWYEAVAYAEFVDKQLPSIYHLKFLAGSWALQEITKKSNLNSTKSWKRGKNAPQNIFGVSDLFGNVREWCYNQRKNDFRSIFGASYDDPIYLVDYLYTGRLTFDRSTSNGFRCIKSLKNAAYNGPLYANVGKTWREYYAEGEPKGAEFAEVFDAQFNYEWRDYYGESPVNDEVFEVYLTQFNYDRDKLNSQLISRDDDEHWVREKVEFQTPYGNHRMVAHIFLPKNVQPPFQPIIFWPGGDANWLDSSEDFLERSGIDFFIRNGRALIMPVYLGTYERRGLEPTGCEDWRICYKERMIKMVMELRKSIDYLETRGDIDLEKLAYCGISWGAWNGAYALAVEKRIKAGILASGGLTNLRFLPEADAFNYLPYIDKPVILFNGRYDPIWQMKESIQPYIDYMGTPKEHKKLMVYDDGHVVPRKEFIRESLAFLDEYFGKVESPLTQKPLGLE